MVGPPCALGCSSTNHGVTLPLWTYACDLVRRLLQKGPLLVLRQDTCCHH